MALTARLARRPWKDREMLVENQPDTMKAVREMEVDRVKKLVKVVETTLDQTSRRIANANLKKLWSKRSDIAVMNVKMNSVVFNDKKAKRGLMEGLRRWCYSWRTRAKVAVILNVTVAPTSTKSIIDILGSTTKCVKKDRSEMRCTCDEKECHGMDKWNGHVFQDMNEFLDRRGLKKPESWTLKSRCAADQRKEESVLNDMFQKLAERVERKTKWIGPAIARPVMPEKVMSGVRLRMQARTEEIPSEETVREFCREAEHVVVAPVDKDPGAAVMICPKCWLDSLDGFTGEMTKLSKEEEGRRRQWLAHAGGKLEHLPHTGLGKMSSHKFGVLKTWPKFKTVVKVRRIQKLLKDGVSRDDWSEEDRNIEEEGWMVLRWRPLVSYAGHRWKGVYRLLGQMCNALIRELRLGLAASSARGVRERVHSFNDGRRRVWSSMKKKGSKKERGRGKGRGKGREKGKRGRGRHGRGQGAENSRDDNTKEEDERPRVRRLRRAILDIKNFFIRVPREKLVPRVRELIKEVQRRRPGVRYFSVEKVMRYSVDTEVPRDVLRQGGWRKMKPGARQRQAFPECTRRGWASIMLSDVEELFRMDEEYGIVMEAGAAYVPVLGFQIGGHAAAGAANLYAADKEEEMMKTMTFMGRVDMERNVVAERWCDDLEMIWDEEASWETRKTLEDMKKPGFYGDELELEEEVNADVSFGFVSRIGGGTLVVRSIPNYEGNTLEKEGKTGAIQSGLQEMSSQRMSAAIQGRMMRILDMKNEGSEWVLWSLKRLVAELVRCDYEAKTVERAIRKVQLSAWLDLAEVRQAAKWSKLEAEVFAATYDEARRMQRQLDEEVVKKERETTRRERIARRRRRGRQRGG